MCIGVRTQKMNGEPLNKTMAKITQSIQVFIKEATHRALVAAGDGNHLRILLAETWLLNTTRDIQYVQTEKLSRGYAFKVLRGDRFDSYVEMLCKHLKIISVEYVVEVTKTRPTVIRIK